MMILKQAIIKSYLKWKIEGAQMSVFHLFGIYNNNKKILSNAQHVYNYTIAQMSVGRYLIFLEFTTKNIVQIIQGWVFPVQNLFLPSKMG